MEVAWNQGGPVTLLELKPPHDLTAEALRMALNKGTGRHQRKLETKLIIESPQATDV